MKKKTGLFKIIMFILLGMVVASWLFSSSYFYNGELMDMEMKSIGFFDYFSLIFGAFEFEYFLQTFILLVCIGAFYGVLNKTGKYRAWVESIANKCKGREFAVLVLTAFIFAIINAVFEYGFILFIFVPFVISILLAMGYNKITTIVAVFGSMLVGTIGSLMGYNTVGVTSQLLDISQNVGFYYRLALFMLAFIAEMIYLSKAKRVKNSDMKDLEKEDLYIGEKTSNKYSAVPIIVTFCVIAVLIILACTNWADTFKVEFFTKIHTKVMEWSPKLPYLHFTTEGVKVGTEKVAIISKIFGAITEFGTWYFAEMSVVLLISSLILGRIYKLESTFEAMVEGVKKIVKPALMVMLCFTVVYFAGMNMFFPTIAKFILGISSKFSVILSSIVTLIGSVLHVDILYVANYVAPQIGAVDGANASVVALITQAIYGCTMFIAPTSMFIAFALTYLNVTYKEWVKKTWKLTLALFGISLVVLLVAKFL
jgi:uncharacterized ion transporter superfamily protein YfcC